jgi:hypothetical protein
MLCVSGSFVWDMPTIIGDNPVLLVVNKADLLPKSGLEHHKRLENWCVALLALSVCVVRLVCYLLAMCLL